MRILLAAAALAAAIGAASAADKPHRPVPIPIPIPVPKPAPNLRASLQDLVANKAEVVADLRNADAMVSAIVPGSSPPRMWDPITHMCLVGIGKAGEPGHVPGLIAFVEGLSAPPPVPSGGNDPNNPMLFSHFIAARLTVMSAESNIGDIVANGFPVSLEQTCGALINSVAAQGSQLVAQAVSVGALIGIIAPK